MGRSGKLNLAFCFSLIICGAMSMFHADALAQTMDTYSIQPPFISSAVPPQVLFTMGKDHKMYYPAYNDSSDIGGPNGEEELDGILDTGYNHKIDYYGYFDPYKCYSYSSGVFIPYGVTSTKYCEASNCATGAGDAISCSGKWSGNFLNWVAMSRADIIKMVIYGGYRTSDNNGTDYAEVSGEYIPPDGHIWGKEYLGADSSKLFPIGINNKRALFCVNGVGTGSGRRAQLKVLPDVSAVPGVSAGVAAAGGLRAWHWINVNGNANICADDKIDLNNDGVAESATLTSRANLNVSVRVCKPGDGFMDSEWEKKHCKKYGSNGRPVGLMQLYGESDSSGEVCTKDLSTSCTSDNQCSSVTPSKGQCVEKANMFFGLMMGSYKNPKAGGYLRKNIWSIMNETNQSNGTFQTSNTDGKGLIMKSIEELRCPETYPLSTHWGNPVGELLYESMRYWTGLQTPTSQFVSGISGGANGDNSNFSVKPDWDRPGTLFPYCSKPFVLLFSDSYNSYDDDQLPGSAFSSFSNSNGELTGLNVEELSNRIAQNEGLTSGSALIGQVGTVAGASDIGACTSKSITGLGNLRGLCPSEGDQRGTYYPAAVALHGHSLTPSINTFVVSFNSVTPEIPINAGGKKATIVPYGKSKNGSACTDTATLTGNLTSTTPSRGLILTPTGTVSTCNTLQTTSFYILGTPNDDPQSPSDPNSPRYDASGNLTYLKFLWGTDDIGGGDFDLDMLEEYEICTGSNVGGCKDFNGNALSMSSNQIAVTVRGVKAAAGNYAALGFIMSGTGSTDGAYLPVRKKDGGPDGDNQGTWASIPENRTMIFTATGEGGTLLKDPLWYAAKYGGFNDLDEDGLPFTDSTCDPLTRGAAARNAKCDEWDTKGKGVPDNYFLISNPRHVENKLRAALEAILARTSSGTAASIVNNRGQSGSNIVTAVFYPQKMFDKDKKIGWLGDLQNFWYYFDPNLESSSIREDNDADSPKVLDLLHDYKVDITFDPLQNKTVARLFQDMGNGTFESRGQLNDTDDLTPLWRAGKLLYHRDLVDNPRKIYTTIDGTSFLNFNHTSPNPTTLKPYLRAADDAEAESIIKYVQGYEPADLNDNSIRRRTAEYKGFNALQPERGVGVWKLGDIISSTPKIQANKPLHGYHIDYADKTYSQFTTTENYKKRGMVFVGGNDGMLHAFKLGKVSPLAGLTQIARLNDSGTTGNPVGFEEWAFVPKDSLPYLKYLKDPNYSHLYYVDNTTMLVEASTECATTEYWNCAKDANSWRTFLIGGMGLGGASKTADKNCASVSLNCVQAPINIESFEEVGLSSYFVLDVTDPESPSLKWRFSHPELGYSTVDPVIVRVNGKKGSGPNPEKPDTSKNGRWFVIFASGPTGPIEPISHQFYGKSDQNLKLFVVDLKTGSLVHTIDTGIQKAFAGSLANNALDNDKINKASTSYYSTDVVYVGYVKESGGQWSDGGLGRLVTNSSLNPQDWRFSKVIDNVGPVTAAIETLYDDTDKESGKPELWLFFGGGRYYYRSPTDGIDTADNLMTIYGVKDPCYSVTVNGGGVAEKDGSKRINFECVQNPSLATISKSSLTDNSASPPKSELDDLGKNGWYITLDPSGTYPDVNGNSIDYKAERMITTPAARTNGLVLFTTFKPSADICGFGGGTMYWLVNYATGGSPKAGTLKGKVLIQLSTGAIVILDLSDVDLTSDGSGGSITSYRGNRQVVVGEGKPPTPAPNLDTLRRPVKKVLQIQER